MNKKILLLVLSFMFLVLFITPCWAVTAVNNVTSDGKYYTDRLYIQLISWPMQQNVFIKNSDGKTFSVSSATEYASLKSTFTYYGVIQIKEFAPGLVRDAFEINCALGKAQALIEALNANFKTIFQFVEGVPVVKISLTPNDPKFSSQWYLSKISASAAWDKIKAATPVVIAIVDDAVKITHEDSCSNTGYDVADNDSVYNPPSTANSTNRYFTHGTHVAGIAGAVTNNSKGLASISDNLVKIMAIKTKKDSNTDTASLDSPIEGVKYAINAGANVINMSWGGYGYSRVEQQLFDTAYNRGIICVAAAGNESIDFPAYPASYNHVISVGATDANDLKASFSNYGSSVDVMAPGVNILSTVTGNTQATVNSYASFDGTSMASPLVAGLCALMLSQDRTLTPDNLEAILKASCDNIDSLNPVYAGNLGAGRINAYKAMQATIQATQVPPQAEFSSNYQTVVQGYHTTFAANITKGNSGVTYSWTFPGGTPATSTATNPYVQYNSTGIYDATLTLTNSYGSISLFKPAYINVITPSQYINWSGREDDYWMFAENNGLHFNHNGLPPDVLKHGTSTGVGNNEGACAISNYDGNLLFYGNPFTLWNRFYNPMADNLSGDWSSTQGILIVPRPINPGDYDVHQYYVFTTEAKDALYQSGLSYSIVDMNLNGGLGSVISGKKNILLSKNIDSTLLHVNEKLIAIPHCNGQDIWIIAYAVDSNQFLVYLLTANGLDTTPISGNNLGPRNNIACSGEMASSPEGSKIAVIFYPGIIDIFNFDRSTGKLSNYQNLVNNPDRSFYGLEFSPDGGKLYYSLYKKAGVEYSSIYQIDLNSGSSSCIFDDYGYKGGIIELAPDNKIYASTNLSISGDTNYIKVINSPDGLGSSCNFKPQGVKLLNKKLSYGLANSFISKYVNYYRKLSNSDENVKLCAGSSVTLQAPTGLNYKYVWSDKDSVTGKSDQSTLIVTKGGTYWVRVTCTDGCSATITYNVLEEKPAVYLGPDITVKAGTSVPLNAGTGYKTYTWYQNGGIISGPNSQSYVFTTNTVGIYTIKVAVSTANGCLASDDVKITVNSSLPITGQLTYDNDNNTGLCFVTLTLKEYPSGKVIATTTTDAYGNYRFDNLKNGTYTIQASTTHSVGGITPTDALLVNNYYIGKYKFGDTLKAKAADVNADGKINPTDALLINKYCIGLVTSFKAGAWIFENNIITVGTSDVTYNFRGICVGDVDGSFIYTCGEL